MAATSAPQPPTAADRGQLVDEIAQFYADPLGFVLYAYPWGEVGTPLADESGPDTWQREFLQDLGREVEDRGFDAVNAVRPIRMAAASGHGIGKSTLVAWLVDWVLSTRSGAVGTITANTFPQLKSKTWPQIQKWSRMLINADWFSVGAEKIAHRSAPETWFASLQTCREENSEAFAGQHAKTSTSFYIFDEASAIPEVIWEVAEGGLTDGEPMVFSFGNPTRNTGKFHRIVFGSERLRWNHRSIDSRTSKIANQAQIAEWIADYGIDSDFVRVRVLGQPPAASELQYVDTTRVHEAQKRQVEVLPEEPLVAGLDVSGGGSAWTVMRFRRGRDARSIPPLKISGEQTRNRDATTARIADALNRDYGGHRVAALFVDSAFGAPFCERLKLLGHRVVHEVSFGGPSPDPQHQANYRAFMWTELRDWLDRGAIDTDLGLECGLCAPGYHLNRSNKLVIESKDDIRKRGEALPDDGAALDHADSLALTFAQAVAPRKPQPKDEDLWGGSRGPGGWMT